LAGPALDQAAQPRVAAFVEEAEVLHLAGQSPRLDARALGHRFPQRGGQGLGRGQDPVHVHVEPAVHRVLDEVAAHEEHEARGRHRHQQEHEQEPHAEARPELAPPPLEQDLHQVPAQHEEKGQEQQQVEDGEPVEEDRGQEVGGEVAALPQQHLEAREEREQAEGDGGDQPDVVAKSGAGHGAGPSGPTGRL
jgi:hypothetical protein